MAGKSVKQNISYSDDPATRILELLTTLGRMNSLRDPLASLVESMGLTPPQLHAVLWVGKEERLTMGEVAQRVGVTEKTVTGIIDRLEGQDYVRRVRDSADRRVVQVELTEKGLATYREFDEEIKRKLILFLSLLEPSDEQALLRIMERLVERVSSLGHPSSGPDEEAAS